MTNVWFTRVTGTSDTWSEQESGATDRNGTASVSCSSTVVVVGRHAARVAPTVSSTATPSTGSMGYITGGGLLAINAAGYNLQLPVTATVTVDAVGHHKTVAAVVSATTVEAVGEQNFSTGSGVASTSATSSITIAKTTARSKTITVTVRSTLRVNPATGAYPTLAQLIGTVRESSDGLRVDRARSGKPRFRNYYTRTRHVFKVVHECNLVDKQAIETHYSTGRMKAFNFTFAPDGETYQALYASTPKYTPVAGVDRWLIETVLIEQ